VLANLPRLVRTKVSTVVQGGVARPLERLAHAFTRFAERWLPDAFVFALLATVVVFGAGLWISAAPLALVDAWGHGFWELLGFTMQMALVIITGHVIAYSRPVHRLIGALAARLWSPRLAVGAVTAFALASSWLNWGFSLIFSAVLAKEIARRHRAIDYRALGAASLLGLGSVWAQGLSGSAALQMATASALPARVREIVAAGGAVPGGVIDFRHTIFLWQSLVSVAVELLVVTTVMVLVTPLGERARPAAALGIDLGADPPPELPTAAARPGERLERSRTLTLLMVLLGGAYLTRAALADPIAALSLNHINMALLLLGMALHGTPARLLAAVREATPASWGVILQFPFYAGMAGMIASTGLNERIAGVFVRIASPRTFPSLMAAYSAALGLFVPSGGGKWLIEAPYVMRAAHSLGVHLGWVVACYDLGEALANLVQPFWMLPVLALLGLRARDVMGYTFVVFLVLLPLVLLMTGLLGATLPYPL
jgi:short-chain fatty acids transporter